jgi:uncharacterized protein (TIGR00730 family)
MHPVEPEPPATLDEELLGAEITSVLATETDATRVDRMAAELRSSFAAMHQVTCGVSMLGSARTPTTHADYALARETARRLGVAGFEIITGGGPGIMQAANQGAQDASALSIGLDIDLPFESDINPYVDLHVPFHYFFTRKISFVRYSSAFVVLPGGVGTLDELFEAWSWNALGYHAKPFCLLNVDGFWDGMITFIDHATESGFLSAKRREQLLVASTPEEALELLDEAAAAATQGMVW